MSEGALSVQAEGNNATKPIPTLLTTAIEVPPPDADKVSTPTSPTELPTVVATKPPFSLAKVAADDEEKKAEPLSAVAETATEETVTSADTKPTTANIPADDSAGGSEYTDAEESFGTAEAKPPVPAMVLAGPSQAHQSTGSGAPPSDAASTEVSAASPTTNEVKAPAPLDTLLSPTETEGKFSQRDSVAASEVTDDETRFSTVLLSARQSLATPIKVAVNSSELITVDEGTGSDESTLVDDWRKHKKTASNSTILSANNVPYLLSKLSEAEEGETRSRPSSLQGTQAIKEGFYQRHEEARAEEDSEEAVDWDFWGEVMNDYQGFAAANPERLAKAIERGIPQTLRGMIWQLMSASKDPELEATYLRLLKESSPHEKSIQRDLGRTFPHHAFFTDGHGIGQENLFNVLKAYSLYDPQVGYCQGLPFIVAILLLNMPDEEAFCLLVRLMHSYDLRGHFLPEMPRLQLRLFERLLEEVLPVLYLHFVRQGVKASMYCSQWFLTMFSYRFPMEIVFRIYDNCLASGIEAMFAFSMALLSKNEATLLSLKFDQLIQFLNQRVFDVYQIGPVIPGQAPTDVRYRVDDFVQDAISLRITPFMLDNYAHEYEELVRARDAHKLEMENLKNTNARLVAQVNSLESAMAQLNTEHCQVLNELVMARLRHEELESELVRYKLLYAEAMHQSEDAMSSHRISLVGSKRGSNSSSRFS
ncbi:rab-GTPase-TBC domain-containing protein [Dichomitus squalens]|uniref:Rab-GTPase-TBC domain-containing protein n=1 Tax=Dichomitus squalens TaxID=114155 RepID=A0A4Q9MJN9_9APHY|nr:rab-GTPase-TBC domain-containing protein [Dichomitus squalens]